MNVLLDTHAFLWIVTDAPQLSVQARESFADPDNEIYLSTVSIWEMTIKHALDKLPLPAAPGLYIPQQRNKHDIASLSLEEEAIFCLERLPALHKDPFDRMLICQSIIHGFVLLTADPLISQYPVRTLW